MHPFRRYCRSPVLSKSSVREEVVLVVKLITHLHNPSFYAHSVLGEWFGSTRDPVLSSSGQRRPLGETRRFCWLVTREDSCFRVSRPLS